MSILIHHGLTNQDPMGLFILWVPGWPVRCWRNQEKGLSLFKRTFRTKQKTKTYIFSVGIMLCFSIGGHWYRVVFRFSGRGFIPKWSPAQSKMLQSAPRIFHPFSEHMPQDGMWQNISLKFWEGISNREFPVKSKEMQMWFWKSIIWQCIKRTKPTTVFHSLHPQRAAKASAGFCMSMHTIVAIHLIIGVIPRPLVKGSSSSTNKASHRCCSRPRQWSYGWDSKGLWHGSEHLTVALDQAGSGYINWLGWYFISEVALNRSITSRHGHGWTLFRKVIIFCIQARTMLGGRRGRWKGWCLWAPGVWHRLAKEEICWWYLSVQKGHCILLCEYTVIPENVK